jgi:citrate lyase beta subunit
MKARGAKKYPKILAVPATAEQFQAAYNFTPAEIRRAKRILEAARKRSSSVAK